jgi:hypothetical protein
MPPRPRPRPRPIRRHPDALPIEAHLLRDPRRPFDRHLLPDFLGPVSELEITPLHHVAPSGANSVALFFNLSTATPPTYVNTTVQDARNWLDEGVDPASPTISEFVRGYWSTLSYGHLSLGVDTPRDAAGVPLVPTVAAPGGNADDWGGLINACLDANPEAVWRAGGSLTVTDGGREFRYVPSVVLVQHYWVHATAGFGGWDRTVGGVDYRIGDVTHMPYDLTFIGTSPTPAVPATTCRAFWGTLCHEYSHNFLQFGDLYGPQGCTGYWDLLGDNSPPGRMSEVCSAIKESIGWLTFKEVVNGPVQARRTLALRPYTTTGEAYKVVPDPAHNPSEYFLLEYRKSTGTEPWRPDAGLPEEGLLVTHMNARMGVAGTWLLREAPYFDPEFADFSDGGSAEWTGWSDLDTIRALYPTASNNSFTAGSRPSSRFYGGRPSGLSITNIRLEGGEVRFELEIAGAPRVAWTVGAGDRALAGRFLPGSDRSGAQVLIRNDDAIALLVNREAQWLAVSRQDDWVGGWNLGPDNYELAADLDGDGLDEVYLRSPEWAGVLKWLPGGGFGTVTVQHDWIGEWNLGGDNREIAADLDGDGAAEVYLRSPDWAGVLKLVGNELRLLSIQHDWIDDWNLGHDNKEYAGRFTENDRDEILIRSPEWIGVFRWDSVASRLVLRSIQHDWVDGWNLSGVDEHTVGDFDGDGIDEIYIRSPQWAGVLKWRLGGFRVLWMRSTDIPRLDAEPAVPLAAGDRSYAGRFLPGKDAVVHRGPDRITVLSWEGSEMRARPAMDVGGGWMGPWRMGADDRWVVGDFTRRGPDVAVPSVDFVADGLDDVFVHNGWGTGAFGVNVLPGVEQIGPTWINATEVLFAD